MPTGRPCTLQLSISEAALVATLAASAIRENERADARDARASAKLATDMEKDAAKAEAITLRTERRARSNLRLRAIRDRANEALAWAKAKGAR